MIALDTNLLSHLLYERNELSDCRTNEPIPDAKDRVEYLIQGLDDSAESILLPSPVVAECLVAASNIEETLQFLKGFSRLEVKPFGEKAAIEYAIRVKRAQAGGDKRDGVKAEWKKVTIDRQVVAIAIAEGASAIYSNDEDIHKHATMFGIESRHIADIELPPGQSELEFEPEESDTADSSDELHE
jgi:predicted nucleic acid-binding protein